MVSLTATNLLTANNMSSADCAATTVELIVDAAIDWINNEAGTSIQAFRDVAYPYTGTSTLTLTTSQNPAVMAGAALMLRAYRDKGPNVVTLGQSITQLVQDPHYKVWSMMLRAAIQRLRGRSFVRT